MNFIIGTPKMIQHLQKQTVIAADVGASSSRRSFGLAWKLQSGICDETACDYHDAIEKLKDLLCDQADVALIIEAPLSGLHSSGNPTLRYFETESTEMPDGKTRIDYRGWYYGAGATTALNALIMLHKLGAIKCSPQFSNTSIFIYEGFVSFKSSKSSDIRDAIRLRDAFLKYDQSDSKQDVIIDPTKFSEEGTPFSLLNMIGLLADSTIPAIIIPRRK